MKAVKILGLVLGIFILLGTIFYAYLGGFQTVTASKGIFESKEIIFYLHRGAYENLSESWDLFQKDWEKAGLKECASLGIYLDPPGTEDEKLRSILGCEIGMLSEEKKSELKKHFKTFVIPKMEVLQSEFPFKNVLSFFVGPTKVYPKFAEIIKNESLETSVSIEVYGNSTSQIETIYFYMPIGVSIEIFKPLIDAFEL
ncbi:hypothetical protein [Leptospira sp. GIMC2001]|uniref:hypothetical protein n=1 Tax=Leptospira sp. GIMC2001 TaxID=1513297 RepID=UPI002349A844|nr:hypothetical protein [Leptospira sp. GIMC2001]WCL49126.1 hypothetical protein O4O04_17820 [Leptospira sp. GIMC2001]